MSGGETTGDAQRQADGGEYDNDVGGPNWLSRVPNQPFYTAGQQQYIYAMSLDETEIQWCYKVQDM
jgi:hypothetical protein